MNMWLKVQVLVLLFCLSSSAPAQQDCQSLIEPEALDGPAKMFGNWTFIRGYNSHEIYQQFLKITQISKTEIKAGSSSNEVIMVQENKMNGTCLGSTSVLTFDRNTATMTVSNISASTHMLSTCSSCMVLRINYTSSASALNKVLQTMNLDVKESSEEVTATALYLFSTGSTVDQPDLDRFTTQANCLGFTQEPQFIYDPKDGYCDKDEIIQVPMK